MKFTVIKTDLLEAMTVVQSVAEKKNVMAILGNVFIEANGPFLKIKATDMDISVSLQIPANVERSGQITIPVHSLFEITKEAVSVDMTFEISKEGRVSVVAGQGEYKIMGRLADDFPNLPEPIGEKQRLKSKELLNILDKVSFAMGHDETRKYLNSILIDYEVDEHSFVATDGHRLAVASQVKALSSTKLTKCILPRKGVLEWRRLLASGEWCDLSFSEKYVFVSNEKINMSIRLIDGLYPDYKKVIPQTINFSIDVPRKDCLGMIKRVSILANDNAKTVVMKFSKGFLSVSSADSQQGEAKEDMALAYDGMDFVIGFNAKYLTEALSIFSEDKITMNFSSSTTPCLLTVASDQNYKSVVMPVRM